MTKYRAKHVIDGGIRFASKAEHRRWLELKMLVAAREIEGLELQPKFPLIVNGVKVCTYIADFRYIDRRTGETITEDVKGMASLPIFRLKKKLVKAVLGIEITEVRVK